VAGGDHLRELAPSAGFSVEGLDLLDRLSPRPELLAAEHDQAARDDRGGVSAARRLQRGQRRPAPRLGVVALDRGQPSVRRPRPATGDHELAVDDRRADVIAAGRHRRAAGPAPTAQVKDLERPQLEVGLGVAAGGVQAPVGPAERERGAGGRHVGEPAPAVAARAVAVEAVGLGLAGPGAGQVAAGEVEPAAERGDARMVDGDRQVGDPAPAVGRDVVADHAPGGAAARDEAADDVDAIADPRGADLGAGERAGRERGPRGLAGARRTRLAAAGGRVDDRRGARQRGGCGKDDAEAERSHPGAPAARASKPAHSPTGSRGYFG
jgi:hypothetical protein